MRNLYDEGKFSFLIVSKGLNKQLRNCFILLIILTSADILPAQLVVTQSADAQALAQSLAGPGVTVSNFSRSGNNNSTGTFSSTSTNLGINAGVVLSTGNVANISKPASNFASTSYSGYGDAQIQTLTGGYVYDKTVLEFDIVPQGNVLMFNYVFASEEYPEWVCSQFNDVFGFFISGPNPAGGNYSSKNIAKVPNSNLPVAINTINPGVSGAYGITSNCQSLAFSSYYRDNLSPTVNPDIVFDGMTTVLTAIASVMPCQTYHLKLAVADVNDRIYDSGVFIEANSITSVPITITSTTQLASQGYNAAYEGCVGGKFTFSMPSVKPNDVQVKVQISGTATNGVDYPTIPSVITIPAGHLSTDINVMPIQDNVTEGDETIIISTSNPCTGQVISSAQMVIKDDVPALVNANPEAICSGQSTQLTASGGLNYSWSPPLHLSQDSIYNPVATPDTTTTYTVTMDWGSCQKSASKTITVGGSTVQLAASPSFTSCDGSPVQLSVNGASSYSWNSGSNASSIQVTSNGDYTVTATDAVGCSATATAHVVISNLSITNPSVAPSCSGGNNGGVNISVSGNGAPFTYQWSNNTNAPNLAQAGAGNYTVTVTNADGCSATQTFTVAQVNSNLNLNASVTDVSCQTGGSGNIALTVNGGNTPYQFAWSNGGNTQNLNNIASGNYQVTVTDNTGCNSTATYTVGQVNGVNATLTKTDVTCNGGNNGSITVSLSGGTTPYQYQWDDGINTLNRNNLNAGNYVITATDANGCSSVKSINVSEPSVININIQSSASTCANPSGSAQAIVTNGTAPYTFSWSADTAIHAPSVNQLAPGMVTVSVTDANGCSAVQTANINASDNQINADFTYAGNFCESSATINFTNTGTPTSGVHLWNFGGLQTSSAINTSYTFVQAGTYQVTHIITSGYCADTVMKSLTIHPIPSIQATVNNIGCNATNTGSIELSVSNGTSPYTYSWNGGVHTSNRSNLSAGSYQVTVSDANHCEAIYQTTITQSTALSLSETHVNPSCANSANGNIDLTVSGGNSPYTFVWNNGSASENLTALSGGNYVVTVNDANNCSATKSIQLSEPAALMVNGNKTDVSCHGMNNGNIVVQVSGGNGNYQYTWNNGVSSQNITSASAGYYTLTVTDGNNCSEVAHFTIDEPAALSVMANKTNPLCFGQATGAIDLDVHGGSQPYGFAWNNGVDSSSLSNLNPGVYAVTITDQKGCETQTNVTLTQPSAIAIGETHTLLGCSDTANASITLTVSGGHPSYMYQWNNGANTSIIQHLNIGEYSATITDANGCVAQTNPIQIKQVPPINISTQITDAACEGIGNGSIHLNVSGGKAPYHFNWTTGQTSQNLNQLSEGEYEVTVTGALGCVKTATALVKSSKNLQAHAQVLSPSCLMPEGVIELNMLNGVAPYTYQWNNGATTNRLSDLQPGTYTVAVRDANNCPFDTAIIVSDYTPFEVHATGSASVVMGESVQLQATSTGSDQVSYNWSPSHDISCATCSETSVVPARSTVYTVVATDTNGCVAQDTVSIEVTAKDNLFLPNAFTPNGDGTNDDLQLYGNLASIHNFQLLIFDRWGEKVYETNDQYFKWDGTYKGKKLDPAAYIYIMKVVRLDGSTDRIYKGALTLL